MHGNGTPSTPLWLRLARSPRFSSYQEAFRTATGLPLRLVPPDPEVWCLDDQATNRSPFCETLNLCGSTCLACVETNYRLMKEARVNGPTTCHCFAGLCASAVPVRDSGEIIAFLKTGQVFNQRPTEERFEELLSSMGRKTVDEATRALLHKAYFETSHVDPQRYQSMITLLGIFAEQLGDLAGTLAAIQSDQLPPAMEKARHYIENRLDQPIHLDDVARFSGLSSSRFCHLFKDTFGITLTDYVNRLRVDHARHELLKPGSRVSDIAFAIGYQSLSQFNRSFLRLTGVSPTDYRKRELAAS